jgi:hypothetical protein
VRAVVYVCVVGYVVCVCAVGYRPVSVSPGLSNPASKLEYGISQGRPSFFPFHPSISSQSACTHIPRTLHISGKLQPWEGPAVVIDGSLVARSSHHAPAPAAQHEPLQQQQDGSEEVWEMMELQGLGTTGGVGEQGVGERSVQQAKEGPCSAEWEEHSRTKALQVGGGQGAPHVCVCVCVCICVCMCACVIMLGTAFVFVYSPRKRKCHSAPRMCSHQLRAL